MAQHNVTSCVDCIVIHIMSYNQKLRIEGRLPLGLPRGRSAGGRSPDGVRQRRAPTLRLQTPTITTAITTVNHIINTLSCLVLSAATA